MFKKILILASMVLYSVPMDDNTFDIEIIRGSSPELFETDLSDGDELSHGSDTDFTDIKEIQVEPEQVVYYLKPEDYGHLVVAKRETGLLRAILACLRCRRK